MRHFPLILLACLASTSSWGKPSPRHMGPVTCIAFGKHEVYSCSQSGILSGVGSDLKRVCAPDFRTTSFRPIPAGLFLAGGNPGESGNFAIYRFESGDFEINETIAEDLVYAVATLNDTAFFAAENAVRVFSKHGLEWRHQHTAATRAVAISPNQNFLASGGMDRAVILSRQKAPDSEISLQNHTAAVECLAFSPGSIRLASGARDGKVRIHAVPEGKLVRTYHHLDGEVGAIAWNESHLLAGTSKGKIYRLDPTSDASAIVTDWGDESPITALALNEKNEVFAGTLNRVERVEISDRR